MAGGRMRPLSEMCIAAIGGIGMALPRFRRITIGELNNEADGGDMNTLFNVADLNRDRKLDIASRPLHGPNRWKIFLWINEGFHAP
jgi:hypothetical protein